MYKVVRNILFLFPTEWIHYFSMNCMKIICSIPFMKSLIKKVFNADDPALDSHIGKLRFKNPVGLGAGFDKNAKYLRELEILGFGFVEIGTVTPLPQKGNDKPRLFRLPKDNALINRMGFNNDGVKTVAKRLKKWKEKQLIVASRESAVDSRQNDSPLTTHLPIAIGTRLIIGGNIGKNKITPNEDAWKDYETCFKELHPYVDYFVVNVSSPNTPGLRELQEKESLRKILMHLQMINNGKALSKPIFLKIAPDLTQEQIDDVVELSLEIKLDGLVATNTTISRDGLTTDHSQLTSIGAGGLSGLPLKDKATEIVRYISSRSNGAIPIIASGGIFDSQHAKEKLDAGATLLQVWTGFIYEGPGIVKKICKAIKDEQYPA
jgi:dihydroorotate dehydrogenase